MLPIFAYSTISHFVQRNSVHICSNYATVATLHRMTEQKVTKTASETNIRQTLPNQKITYYPVQI